MDGGHLHMSLADASGRVTGGTSGVASVCGPIASRTTPKSGSAGRRSHTR